MMREARCQPGHTESSNDRACRHRQIFDEASREQALQRIRFTEVAVSKWPKDSGNKTREVPGGELASGARLSDAARVPSGVKFPFVNAESREQSARASRLTRAPARPRQTRSTRAPKPETEQFADVFGRGHSCPRRKGLPACALD